VYFVALSLVRRRRSTKCTPVALLLGGLGRRHDEMESLTPIPRPHVLVEDLPARSDQPLIGSRTSA
jgi:hypothetical protein